ncbi:hypothetical protein BH09BAC6_BH09BAC6_09280 [soil metagenome]
MILIITFKEDYTADFIINKLNKKGIAYKRLNCEDILTYPYTLKFSDKSSLSLMGENHFEAVWFRRTKLPSLSEFSIAERIYLSGEIEAFIKNLFCLIEAKWVSDPFYVYKAENKFLQLREAAKLGFKIPDTLITNSKEELAEFYVAHERKIIVKPIAQTRINYSDDPQFIFTDAVTDNTMATIAEHDLTPCLFQENVSKLHELRVTVVGSKVFTAAVYSQKDSQTTIDWRRKKLPFHISELPVDIEQKCIKLVEVLQLKFGAIDLIKDKNGEYIFLEINPNGQWAWIESQTGMPISDAIIDELLC